MEPQSVVRTYWLHIVEIKSQQLGVPSTYTLAINTNATGGAMPSVPPPSLEYLSTLLSSVGIGEDVLRDTKAALDKTGSHAIPEVILSGDQLKLLGYLDVAA
jgi:hypothetical protein